MASEHLTSAQAERIQQKLKWLDERLSTRIAETTEDEFRNHPDYRSVTAQLERLSNDGQRRLSDLQKRCVKWGYFNTLLPGVGGLILSLYMGLGKTAVTVALIDLLVTRFPEIRFLILGPKSVQHGWDKEVDLWLRQRRDYASVNVDMTSEEVKDALKKRVVFAAYTAVDQPEGVRIPGVWFENVGNLFLVMDEFQMRYRSPAFQRRINHAPKLYRFAVTGTAFKNNAWAQWRFFENCFPGLFLNENFSMIHGFLEKSRHRDFIPTQLDDATLKLIKTFFVKVRRAGLIAQNTTAELLANIPVPLHLYPVLAAWSREHHKAFMALLREYLSSTGDSRVSPATLSLGAITPHYNLSVAEFLKLPMEKQAEGKFGLLKNVIEFHVGPPTLSREAADEALKLEASTTKKAFEEKVLNNWEAAIAKIEEEKKQKKTQAEKEKEKEKEKDKETEKEKEKEKDKEKGKGKQKEKERKSKHFVVFVKHLGALDLTVAFLKKLGYRVATIAGKGGLHRPSVLIAFGYGLIDILVITFEAGGAGINLQIADAFALLEIPTDYPVFKQMPSRLWRIGQEFPVHGYLLISAYAVDPYLLRKLMEAKEFASLFGSDAQKTLAQGSAPTAQPQNAAADVEDAAAEYDADAVSDEEAEEDAAPRETARQREQAAELKLNSNSYALAAFSEQLYQDQVRLTPNDVPQYRVSHDIALMSTFGSLVARQESVASLGNINFSRERTDYLKLQESNKLASENMIHAHLPTTAAKNAAKALQTQRELEQRPRLLEDKLKTTTTATASTASVDAAPADVPVVTTSATLIGSDVGGGAQMPPPRIQARRDTHRAPVKASGKRRQQVLDLFGDEEDSQEEETPLELESQSSDSSLSAAADGEDEGDRDRLIVGDSEESSKSSYIIDLDDEGPVINDRDDDDEDGGQEAEELEDSSEQGEEHSGSGGESAEAGAEEPQRVPPLFPRPSSPLKPATRGKAGAAVQPENPREDVSRRKTQTSPQKEVPAAPEPAIDLRGGAFHATDSDIVLERFVPALQRSVPNNALRVESLERRGGGFVVQLDERARLMDDADIFARLAPSLAVADLDVALRYASRGLAIGAAFDYLLRTAAGLTSATLLRECATAIVERRCVLRLASARFFLTLLERPWAAALRDNQVIRDARVICDTSVTRTNPSALLLAAAQSAIDAHDTDLSAGLL